VSVAAPSFGFDSITDFVANTGTAAGNTINGDRIQFAVFAGLSYQANANLASAGTSLLNDLFTSEFFGGGFNAGDNDVFGVTITGAVAWAGNYIMSDTNGDGAVTVADNIVKLNTLSGIVANTFIG
jgi:hypothetical protein